MKEKEKTILGCMSGIIEDIRDTEKKFNEKIFEEKAEEIEYISTMCGDSLAVCIALVHYRKE